MSKPSLKTIIISAPSGSGKTFFLEKFYEAAIKNAYSCLGVFSRRNSTTEGIRSYELIISGQRKSMELCSSQSKKGYFAFKELFFNPRAFHKGASFLSSSIKKKPDFLIIDEAGPLELLEKGWHSNILQAMENYHGVLLISIRPALVEKMANFLTFSDYILIDPACTPMQAGIQKVFNEYYSQKHF
jgi:nucleoside-triphosphatase THEP1